jgi:hypothetical protein
VVFSLNDFRRPFVYRVRGRYCDDRAMTSQTPGAAVRQLRCLDGRLLPPNWICEALDWICYDLTRLENADAGFRPAGTVPRGGTGGTPRPRATS